MTYLLWLIIIYYCLIVLLSFRPHTLISCYEICVVRRYKTGVIVISGTRSVLLVHVCIYFIESCLWTFVTIHFLIQRIFNLLVDSLFLLLHLQLDRALRAHTHTPMMFDLLRMSRMGAVDKPQVYWREKCTICRACEPCSAIPRVQKAVFHRYMYLWICCNYIMHR